LRFFNVYGPNGRPDMMPLRVLDAIINQREITLFNGGAMRRDWTYIDDVVDGITAALDKPMGYEIINLGCGQPETMTAFITIMEDLTGRQALIKDVPAPSSEPPITYCDNSKARALLGFDPKVSLRQGLQNTWEWYRARHGLS
ncbi:MAG: NAD-dependent epimerase/dehydratase family protein, partial [Anaerolineae bacterium]|nr:NAD-dependent epimerase/dehydratase family protein [Anaerolineae bacterium]